MTRNHTGHRIGECHQRAKLSSAQVAAMRADHAAGLSYRRLALKYHCGISTARDICTYRTRWAG
ncbi:hypothetical protein HG264_04145 [Pseudomonas sp. gcc21]|uniref:hypothetical protein n=1 Tax=Pseudomonas sp. gcc21 TaxID=2726989 RepID=UPI0014518C66|nr:hypothetical protein [Pseudomonas sp. gcc21]QJD58162.1 hypothetical protein HG264_04145 [Pseudomonas sp. gcc21]